ncbi:MAG: helix-turn-helix domain-containing protein [Bacteroidota bacterium]
MKRNIFLPVGLTVLLIALFLWWNAGAGTDAFQEAKTEVSMRKIGHEVLLLSGDRTSRVLPVERLATNGYRLRFEARFAFVPGLLMSTIHRVVKAEQLPADYIVRVRECQHDQVVYSYRMGSQREMTKAPETGSSNQCSERKQPENCYSIELLLQPQNRFSGWLIPTLLFGFVLLSMIVILVVKNRRNRKQSAEIAQLKEAGSDRAVIVLANYRFHYRDRYLMLGPEQIRLTAKQTKLLYLFASSPNQIIERATLTKVWEDEGVIVGRSLDVFVSKLRKIFEADPSVRLVNVHSRGYILEVDA